MWRTEGLLEKRLLFFGDQFDQTALHLEEGDLDRVLLASLDQRSGTANEFAHALLKQSGLVKGTVH